LCQEEPIEEPVQDKECIEEKDMSAEEEENLEDLFMGEEEEISRGELRDLMITKHNPNRTNNQYSKNNNNKQEAKKVKE
jgi:hypothetical protein